MGDDPPESADGGESDRSQDSGPQSRDVVVPLRLYKTVTVFSTLFAVAFVLGGFVLIDVATDRATADVSEIDPVLAILGLAGIVGGAAIYAFSTRFRAEGMGKAKDESDESSGNG
ncbi:MAG: hypothetical protein V5A39_09730 [Haloarculaceae archaeon]